MKKPIEDLNEISFFGRSSQKMNTRSQKYLMKKRLCKDFVKKIFQNLSLKNLQKIFQKIFIKISRRMRSSEDLHMPSS